ncbi:phosphodiester glycosidase family protein [Microbacterium invictum]|uniref:Phosphodiester glycosidase family protein n=1 Tax=Microbacterium invictum TaxID=515415 RepID=A0ABZ0VE54_9MICO|nr:phosphodiester glycosidase family protein [Microbacterium invictum]WQB71193.1 phosphodiester glycosidase family protein [Microbacterium invictum]
MRSPNTVTAPLPTASAPQADDRKRRRRRWPNVAIGAVLVVVLSLGGTAVWAVDRFLIEHVEIADVSAYEEANSTLTDTDSTDDAGTDTDGSTDTDDGGTAVVTDTSYTDDDTSITISTVTTGTGDDTVTYYVADVTVTDATQLRSAFAKDQFGENITETTSQIASDNDAILAVNGDYYGFRSTGIEIRNGVIYRDEGVREGLAFFLDGHVEVYDETATTAEDLLADGVWNTVSFGPAIVEDGETVAGIEDVEVDTNVGNHSIQGDQPRTAIGIIDDNHYVFVVVDGRSPGYSAGVTLTELAEIMTSLGATTAYNLDGGGSSTLYFNGEVVNQPSNGGERGTSDILYVAG